MRFSCAKLSLGFLFFINLRKCTAKGRSAWCALVKRVLFVGIDSPRGAAQILPYCTIDRFFDSGGISINMYWSLGLRNCQRKSFGKLILNCNNHSLTMIKNLGTMNAAKKTRVGASVHARVHLLAHKRAKCAEAKIFRGSYFDPIITI